MKTRLSSILVFVVALCGLLLVGAVHAAEPVNDVRILMDVSGSMKKNDPQNLRIPALRMMSELLPNGTRAGVWTFGRYVNMQVKLGVVDEAWKQRAAEGAEALHSRGLFTNIEGAIARSTRDWREPDPRYQRSLILMTDGVVDVSKVAGKNAASRDNILDQQLERLQNAGVKIYTIALSDAADVELLSTLADESEGWFEMADSADQLQRAFLRMFDKTVQADTVPLKDNRFTIDASINELTLLVFKEADAENVEVILPNSQHGLSIDNNPLGYKWIDHGGYELVTIPSPPEGDWQIIGAQDPDNRVVVVTDLRLKVDEIPNQLPPENNLTVKASLFEEGERITRADFLDLVSMTLTVEAEAGEILHLEFLESESHYSLELDPQNGVFSIDLPALGEGEYELELNVDGGTFSRAFEHTLDVQWPVSVKLEQDYEGQEGSYLAIVAPLGEVVDIESASLKSWLETADGAKHDTQQLRQGHGWLVSVNMQQHTGDAKLFLRFEARAKNGDPIDQTLAPFNLPGPVTETPVPENEVQEEPLAEALEAQGTNWILIGGIAGGGFVVVLLLSFIVWKVLRKKKAAKEEDDTSSDLIEVEEEDEEPEAQDEPEPIAESADVPTAIEQPEEESDTTAVTAEESEVVDSKSADFNDYEENQAAKAESDSVVDAEEAAQPESEPDTEDAAQVDPEDAANTNDQAVDDEKENMPKTGTG